MAEMPLLGYMSEMGSDSHTDLLLRLSVKT